MFLLDSSDIDKIIKKNIKYSYVPFQDLSFIYILNNSESWDIYINDCINQFLKLHISETPSAKLYAT